MRKLYVIFLGAIILVIPSSFNACGVPNSTSSVSTTSSTIEQNGGTTGNPLTPLRARAYSLQRDYLSCFKTLKLRRTDGTAVAINVLERPTSISFTGTEFGAFEFPDGSYDQIILSFVPKCLLDESGTLLSFAMTNDHGFFASSDLIVMKFDGNFAYPDPLGRIPVLDLTPIVEQLEDVTSDDEVAPAAAQENGTFALE